MLTVLLECCDQENELAQTLSALVAGAVDGVIADVVILDCGSRDGTWELADAAGCRFHRDWTLADILASARGEWLLLVEPGARPLQGWVEEILDYVAVNSEPARFAPSRAHRRPLLTRLRRRAGPLERGILLRKSQALAALSGGARLADLATGLRSRSLRSEMAPAWAARRALR